MTDQLASTPKSARSRNKLTAGPGPLQNEIVQFLDHLVLAQGRAVNTLLAYRRDLAHYDQFCGTQGITHPQEIDSRLVGDFVAHLTRQEMAPASIARALSAVKSLHRYLLQNDICAGNPARSLRSPRLPRRLPDVLSIRQMHMLINAPPQNHPLAIRDRAILGILYGCGLRVSEAATLALDDIDFEDGFVRIRGKGNRERLAPFGPMTENSLRAYLDGPRFAGTGADSDSGTNIGITERVFLNRLGAKMTRMGLWLLVRRAATLVGLADRVTPHTFRHSFATHLIEAGADLRSVQMMLGHSSVATTQIYTHLDRKHLQSIHRDFHPLEAAPKRA